MWLQVRYRQNVVSRQYQIDSPHKLMEQIEVKLEIVFRCSVQIFLRAVKKRRSSSIIVT